MTPCGPTILIATIFAVAVSLLLACDYRAATYDREVDRPSRVPILSPGRYMGPGEAGTPRSFGVGYVGPFSVDGSDREHVRAATERAIACGCDPRTGQHR